VPNKAPDNKTIAEAILALNPSAQVAVKNDNVDQITWIAGTTPIAKDTILAKQVQLQAAHDALAYKRTRETTYPEFKEFVEAYTEKEIGEDSTKWDAYVTAYNKVRSDNPKP